jgi:dynein heavy chain 1
LWNADLIKYKNQVNEVLAEARGEMILEDFLRKIKDHWGERKLEFSNYKSTQGQNTVVKCKLIKGWDDLLVENEEHTNNISSMKMSPYFKVFEDEIVPWTAKIENMRLIFDSWIDVQRNYVYLEGIFFGSADIKNTLPTEFNRFRGVDNEFVNLMKKVAAKPLVLEVLSIPNLEQNLTRFSDMLQKIQKGLADYLEKQRQSFARFYFVGDEDLLEIIGNSKSVATV